MQNFHFIVSIKQLLTYSVQFLLQFHILAHENSHLLLRTRLWKRFRLSALLLILSFWVFLRSDWDGWSLGKQLLDFIFVFFDHKVFLENGLDEYFFLLLHFFQAELQTVVFLLAFLKRAFLLLQNLLNSVHVRFQFFKLPCGLLNESLVHFL